MPDAQPWLASPEWVQKRISRTISSNSEMTRVGWLAIVAACVLAIALSGCKTRQQESGAVPKTQPDAMPPAQAKLSPTQEPSSAAAMPSNVSETEARALRRYDQNAWFIQEGVRVAQRNETLNTAISALVAAARPDWDHANPSHAQVRGAEISARLRPWVESAPTLEPAKQAAALVVADRVVVMEEEDGNLEPGESERLSAESKPSENLPKSEAQIQLEKIGARFSYDPTTQRNLYTLNWLQRANEIGQNGRAGDLAFLLLMSRGFDTSQNCKNGNELFRQVLRRGAEYLQQHRSADVEARIHFMMGDAYRDIVALAAGQFGDTYADPTVYKPEAANARTKAVAEYRAGLALDDKSEISSIAKDHLRSLQAGEAPHDVTFYCQVLE